VSDHQRWLGDIKSATGGDVSQDAYLQPALPGRRPEGCPTREAAAHRGLRGILGSSAPDALRWREPVNAEGASIISCLEEGS